VLFRSMRGPPVGEWLIEYSSWRWIFLITVPVGGLWLIGFALFAVDHIKNIAHKFDLKGFFLISTTLTTGQLALDRGQLLDWFSSTEVSIEVALAILFFYLSLVHVFTTKNPFIKPAIFRDRNFALGTAISALVGIFLVGAMPIITNFMQQLLGFPVLTTGLVSLPRAIGNVLTVLIAGQIAGKVDHDRLTLTIGKMSVQDIFDDNVYTHDPTKDFLNYAFLTEGAFDYAANAWGYTDGAVAEWRQNWWTVRAGVYQLAQTPGSTKIEPEIFRQFMAVSELEARYELLAQPGALKFLFFSNNGYFSKFEDDIAYAFAANLFPPSVGSVRRRGQKNGFVVNLAQQLAPGVGFFLRGGMNDGRYETIDYTDINASLAGGFVFDGELWSRPDDRIGLAAGASAISDGFARYLQLGGLGSFVGDGSAIEGRLPRYYLPGEPGSPTGTGRLSYGRENVVETFYDYAITDWLEATLDYQFLANPGYNTQRGPVNLFGLRLRAEF